MFERMAVVGAGAIGSIIGGYLSRAGHDITLIDPWAAHVDAIKKNGLHIIAEDEEFTISVNAMHLGEVSSSSTPFDVAFLSVKSYDTVWATHLILPYLTPTGFIVSSQNAINDDIIAPIAGFNRAIGCVITLGAGMYKPGHAIRTSSRAGLAFKLGELNGRTTKRAQHLADMLSVIGPTQITTNLWGERWAKLATNSMANPVAALTGLGSAELRRTPGVVEVSIKICEEVVRVGSALGVEIEPISGIPAEDYERADDAEMMEELQTRLLENTITLGEGRPSMAQDVLKGRRTEIDYLNAYVARRGKEVGIPTPLNEAITRLINQIERGDIEPSLSNIEQLQRYI